MLDSGETELLGNPNSPHFLSLISSCFSPFFLPVLADVGPPRCLLRCWILARGYKPHTPFIKRVTLPGKGTRRYGLMNPVCAVNLCVSYRCPQGRESLLIKCNYNSWGLLFQHKGENPSQRGCFLPERGLQNVRRQRTCKLLSVWSLEESSVS